MDHSTPRAFVDESRSGARTVRATLAIGAAVILALFGRTCRADPEPIQTDRSTRPREGLAADAPRDAALSMERHPAGSQSKSRLEFQGDLDATLLGQVLDARSGAAIAAQVEWAESSSLWTGPSGCFRLLLPSASPVALRVRAAGYSDAVLQETPGTGRLHHLALTRASRVRVRVHREELPAIGAEVHVIATDMPSGFVMRASNGPLFTDTNGIVECPLERSSMLFATLAGEASRPRFTASTVDEIELSIDTGHGRGRLGVRNRDGTPLSGFTIVLGPAQGEAPSVQIATLADGVLPVDLPTGTYRASNASGRAGQRILSPAGIEIAPDQTAWITADEHAGWQVRLVDAGDRSALSNQAFTTQIVLHSAGRERALKEHTALADGDGDVCWWQGESPASAGSEPRLVLRSTKFATHRIANPFAIAPGSVVPLVRRSMCTLIADSSTNPPPWIEIHQGDPNPTRLHLVDRLQYEPFEWSGEDLTIRSLGATLDRVSAMDLATAQTLAFRVPQMSTITLVAPRGVQVGDVLCLSDQGDRIEPTHTDWGVQFEVPRGTSYRIIPRAWSEYFDSVDPGTRGASRATDAILSVPWDDAFAAVFDLEGTLGWLGTTERPTLWIQPVWVPPGLRPAWEPDGDGWRAVVRPDGSYRFSRLPSRPQQLVCGTGSGRALRILGDVSATRVLEFGTVEFESSTLVGELRVSYSPDLGAPSLPGITTVRTVQIANGRGNLTDLPFSVRSIHCTWQKRYFDVAVRLAAGVSTRVMLDDGTR